MAQIILWIESFTIVVMKPTERQICGTTFGVIVHLSQTKGHI